MQKAPEKKPAEVIADELEQELPEIEKVIEAQKKVGNYDVGQICEALAELFSSVKTNSLPPL